MKRLILTICACVLFTSTVALGDWDPGDPNKWAQLPDLTTTGIDVQATYPKLLADDWQCTTTGYVTDIHFWGSWKNDILPEGETAPDPTAIGFGLSIYSDLPDIDNGNPLYSMPAELLWQDTFGPGDFTVKYYADADEGWFNPNTGEYLSDNHQGVWQYNFVAPPGTDPCDLFYQEGTSAEPIVYWLGVTAVPIASGAEPNEPEWGWKTSLDHWNDDAVYTDILPGNTGITGWNELKYPVGHAYEGASIDLAFVITPEPATICLLGLGALGLIRRKR